MAQPLLRIILVLVDPEAMPDWILRLIERVSTSAEMEICAVAEAPRTRRRKKDNVLFRLLYRLELAARSIPAARKSAPANGLPRIALGDGATVGSQMADIILDLSGNHGAGISTALARHGVWFTDATGNVPGIAGVRPLVEGRPVSSINLFRRTQAFAMAELISTAAVNIKFVAAHNQSFIEEKSVTLIMRELKRCALGMPIEKQAGPNLFIAPSAPRTIETLAYLVRMVAELGRRTWKKLGAKLGFRPGMFGLNLTEGDPLKFQPYIANSVTPPQNCFQADPFFWQWGEEIWCFFETYDYHTRLGHITAGRIESGRLESIQTALKPGYHLSFPFLFEHNGQLFMMPECCASQRIELWRCTSFPDKWDLHGTALEGTNLSDSTLAEIDGQWWLFTNICDDPFGDMNSELHLFRADGPMLEKLEPHPLNPVVFNSRCARNAGRIFQRDGVFYRPSQDNSHGVYGYGLHLMRIDRLTIDHYSESSVRHITPTFKQGIIGCHHIDVLDNRIIFDVRYGYGGR